jgi:hypothetical protein
MTLSTPVLPPSGRFIQCIRESSQALVQAEAVTVSIRYLDFQFSPSLRIGTALLVRALRMR